MPDRPLILLTTSAQPDDDPQAPPVDRLGHAYTRAVEGAGGLPVLAPNGLDPAGGERLLERIDGVLLTGGYDVDPAVYSEAVLNDTVVVDARRDALELPLARAAVARGIPLLGICRGIQSLNVALGGTLWQDLPAQMPSPIAHRQSEARSVGTHSVRVEQGTRLARALGGTRVLVNSFHHQAVRHVAAGLRAVAWADDGVVEGVEGEGPGFLLAVQYHPEGMVGVSEEAVRLFRALVDAAMAYAAGSSTSCTR